jgi:hypothetical protein
MRVLVSTTKHTTISPLWVRLHADKIGPSYTPQGGINMQTDKLAGKADLNLLLELKARHKCLNFPEHHIFKIAFNKITPARQPTITKMLFSFWCSTSRHFRNRSQRKLCCFCDSEDEDWKHILSCPGLGATIKRNESCNSLKASQSHFDIPTETWLAIEHRIQYFNTYQEKKETPQHVPPFNGSFVPRKILLNDAFASQSKIGWINFLKGRISRKVGRLLTSKRTTDARDAFEWSMITSLWKHSLQLW